MKPTCIHLVRHGEVHNPDHLLYGRLPRFPLSDRGRRQARITGRYLSQEPVKAIFTSPLLRARQTARNILAFHNGLKLSVSKHLNEVCTAYEGFPGAQVDARDGDLYTGAAACYEQPPDLVRRTRIFFKRILKRFAGADVVAVTHGDIVVFAALWAMGADLDPKNKSRMKKIGYPVAYPEHASITRFTFDCDNSENPPRIDYVNPASTIV
jgi:broad specificity phosphatase PhoE